MNSGVKLNNIAQKLVFRTIMGYLQSGPLFARALARVFSPGACSPAACNTDKTCLPSELSGGSKKNNGGQKCVFGGHMVPGLSFSFRSHFDGWR